MALCLRGSARARGIEVEPVRGERRDRLPPGEMGFSGIVGRHPRMLEVFETIRDVANVPVPVLVQGESGTGKELVARAIHRQGDRAERPFVAVNCSALPENLLESELFGYVRGGFTGAVRDKKGRFALADGGTIFLDEVGDVSPAMQVKLLRVLQEGTFEPVGSERTERVDVRVISATNRDLRRLIARGRFREDLFYRLCVVPIRLPALRERREDILLLASHVLAEALARMARKGVIFSREALQALVDHRWPGNVRELQNAIYHGLIRCKGDVLQPRHLPPGIGETRRSPGDVSRKGRRPKVSGELVKMALEATKGNKMAAARKLGVSRATIYYNLRQLT